MASGCVVWITGLSGAGKTTLARAVAERMPPPTILLDGDEMRGALALLADGYKSGDRRKLALTYSRLCNLVAGQGINVVCATISMFHEVHEWNRANLPGYFEVYLAAEESVRLKRDYKGVYSGGNGAAASVVGVDIVPEFPMNPDYCVEAAHFCVEETAETIFRLLNP